MKCSESYTLLQFEFRIKYINESENTRRSRAAPYPRDADLRNGSHQEGEKEHTYKITSRESLSN
jgi:hypothetical protein